MYTVKTRHGQTCTVVVFWDHAVRWVAEHIGDEPYMLICFGNPEKQVRCTAEGPA